MRISIFGLGYVGTVSATCLAKSGHEIIGVDTNPLKVELINKGISPIVEPGVDELLKKGREEGRIRATLDSSDAIRQSDLSMICVGTPSNPNGSLNEEYLNAVAEQIGAALRRKTEYHALVLRSTAVPGTVDRLQRTIAHSSQKTAGKDFAIASNPEFLREGSAVSDFNNPPFTVVGSNDTRMIEALRTVYADVQAPFHSVQVKEAEFLKYASNAFHATKVTFANEIGVIAKHCGVDSHTVLGLLCKDTKLNISQAYLKPGFAFGGSCLPKDLRALNHLSKQEDIDTPLLQSILVSNSLHVRRAIDWVVNAREKSVGILGLSFKTGTDDLRESPMVEVVETLLGKGFSVSVYDASVNLSKLVGANKMYIEKEIPHISSLMRSTVHEVLDEATVILVASNTEEIREAMLRVSSRHKVLDLVRIAPTWDRQSGAYDGICW
jgi:GDP-mannose 6-dehydrogenase